jgi:hypothetical protein
VKLGSVAQELPLTSFTVGEVSNPYNFGQRYYDIR